MTPSDEQNEGIKSAVDWFKHGKKKYFYLAGYGGSGKSSLARFIVDACGLDGTNPRDVLYGSFTGKASLVMNRKGMRGASTVHQMIYRRVKTEDGSLRFELDPKSRVSETKLVVLDECSMIGDKMARDLLAFGVKVLVLGDPGQLEPVQGQGFFTKSEPDFFLHEIHRQALENPIIRFSMDVREGKEIPWGDHGNVIRMDFDDAPIELMQEADQILTGKHTSRHALNQCMLNAAGHETPLPTIPGLKVICQRNYHDVGLINGLIGNTLDHVTRDMISDSDRCFQQAVHIHEGVRDTSYSTEMMNMSMGAFEDNWEPRSKKQKQKDESHIMASQNERDNSNRILEWDYAYAITVHKAQGSQWDNVILYDDKMLSWKPESRRRWMYTALTRASDNFIILE